jgi:murein hydrolase activator
MKSPNSVLILASLVAAAPLGAEAYDALMRRYEKQIQQQERQLKTLRVNLMQKERDAVRWQQKAEEAKTQWSQAGNSVDQARETAKSFRQHWTKSKTLADAAEWSVTEKSLIAQSADQQSLLLARALWTRRQATALSTPVTVQDRFYEFFLQPVAGLSQVAHLQAAQARQQETSLRVEEMKWQTQERQQTAEVERLHERQQEQWLKWQEALRRKTSLEEERNQLEQSAQALRVMVQELRDHRDQTLAARRDRTTEDRALVSLRGALPWPAQGRVTQNFGRQFSDELQQLLVSNGIKIEAGAGRTVRAIQAGKVLFASPFREYGQLVIVQHRSGLASVYGGLGAVRVKEGDALETLDTVGTVADAGSFYFELRRDEQPINPLVYLTPARSDLSLRRKFR